METTKILSLAKIADEKIFVIRRELELQLFDFIRETLRKEPMLMGFVSGMGEWFFYDKNHYNHSDSWSFKKYGTTIKTVNEIITVLYYTPSVRIYKNEVGEIIVDNED